MIINNASAGIDMSERQKQTKKDLDMKPINQTKMVRPPWRFQWVSIRIFMIYFLDKKHIKKITRQT